MPLKEPLRPPDDVHPKVERYLRHLQQKNKQLESLKRRDVDDKEVQLAEREKGFRLYYNGAYNTRENGGAAPGTSSGTRRNSTTLTDGPQASSEVESSQGKDVGTIGTRLTLPVRLGKPSVTPLKVAVVSGTPSKVQNPSIPTSSKPYVTHNTTTHTRIALPSSRDVKRAVVRPVSRKTKTAGEIRKNRKFTDSEFSQASAAHDKRLKTAPSNTNSSRRKNWLAESTIEIKTNSGEKVRIKKPAPSKAWTRSPSATSKSPRLQTNVKDKQNHVDQDRARSSKAANSDSGVADKTESDDENVDDDSNKVENDGVIEDEEDIREEITLAAENDEDVDSSTENEETPADDNQTSRLSELQHGSKIGETIVLGNMSTSVKKSSQQLSPINHSAISVPLGFLKPKRHLRSKEHQKRLILKPITVEMKSQGPPTKVRPLSSIDVHHQRKKTSRDNFTEDSKSVLKAIKAENEAILESIGRNKALEEIKDDEGGGDKADNLVEEEVKEKRRDRQKVIHTYYGPHAKEIEEERQRGRRRSASSVSNSSSSISPVGRKDSETSNKDDNDPILSGPTPKPGEFNKDIMNAVLQKVMNMDARQQRKLLKALGQLDLRIQTPEIKNNKLRNNRRRAEELVAAAQEKIKQREKRRDEKMMRSVSRLGKSRRKRRRSGKKSKGKDKRISQGRDSVRLHYMNMHEESNSDTCSNMSSTDETSDSDCMDVYHDSTHARKPISGVYIHLLLLNNWGHENRVGLTQIEFHDERGKKIHFNPSHITSVGALETRGDLANIIDGRTKTTKEKHMWSCLLNKKRPVEIYFRVHLRKEEVQRFALSRVSCWNYNKDVSIGVKRCQIYVDYILAYDGEVEAASGDNVFDYHWTTVLDIHEQLKQQVPQMKSNLISSVGSIALRDSLHINDDEKRKSKKRDGRRQKSIGMRSRWRRRSRDMDNVENSDDSEYDLENDHRGYLPAVRSASKPRIRSSKMREKFALPDISRGAIDIKDKVEDRSSEKIKKSRSVDSIPKESRLTRQIDGAVHTSSTNVDLANKL